MKYGILVLVLFFFFQCDENPTNPKEKDPPQVSDEWVSVGAEINSQVIEDLAVDPFTNQTIYVATIQGFFKSTDGAKTWQNLSSGLSSTYILCIAVDPVVQNRLVIGTKSDGLYMSTDGGETWTNRWFDTTIRQVISVHISTDGSYWAGTTDGLFKSTNQGQSWLKGGIMGRVDAVITHPNDPNKVWAGRRYDGIYHSNDAGEKWYTQNNGIQNGSFGYDHAVQFLFHPDSTNELYACTTIGDLCKSTDLGNTWISLLPNLKWQRVNSLYIDPAQSSEMWASSQEAGVLRSVDLGQSWQTFGKGLDEKKLTAIQTMTNDERIVLVGTQGDGLFKHVVQN